jgi:hypothetical protein
LEQFPQELFSAFDFAGRILVKHSVNAVSERFLAYGWLALRIFVLNPVYAVVAKLVRKQYQYKRFPVGVLVRIVRKLYKLLKTVSPVRLPIRDRQDLCREGTVLWNGIQVTGTSG